MIYLPISRLKPGMILARELPSASLSFSLLSVGNALTDEILRRLNKMGVQGAYVENDWGAGIDPGGLVDPQFHRQLLEDVRHICIDYVGRCSSGRIFSEASKLAVELVAQVLESDEALLNIMDIKDYDTYTFHHSVSVGMHSVLIGMRLGLERPRLVELALCGLMHDIGKLEVSPEIVGKTGPLTRQEARQMMRHPALAADRLRGGFPSAVCSGIAAHHEKYDGTGYPRGLAGDKIPLAGRILALADIYDALTSNRPYRPAWSADQAIEYMVSCSGTHHDPALLDVFLQTVAAYPAGSVVRLSNGFTALVTANLPGEALRPVVRVALPEELRGVIIDLAQDRRYLNVTVEAGEPIQDQCYSTLSELLTTSDTAS